MTRLTRRSFVTATAAIGSVAVLPTSAFAISESAARTLVGRLVGDINGVIASGKSPDAIIRDFEGIFRKYADVPTIARSALGPAARGASSTDLGPYTEAFQGYIARKYGKRFREFIGGKIEVQSAEDLGRFFEVKSTATLRGSAPFEIAFRVSDRSGKDLFFDLLIEGISLLSTERVEVGAMLDRAGGSIPTLTRNLSQIG